MMVPSCLRRSLSSFSNEAGASESTKLICFATINTSCYCTNKMSYHLLLGEDLVALLAPGDLMAEVKYCTIKNILPSGIGGGPGGTAGTGGPDGRSKIFIP